VLIDNGSKDETCIEAPRLVNSNFVYRRNESNSGTCKAWNWGICDGFENEADVVLVLNNDVLLTPVAGATYPVGDYPTQIITVR